jgi:glutathione S-transferase
MSHGKQFTLYTHTSGPNGWQVHPPSLPKSLPSEPNLILRKAAIVLEELGLTYEPVYLDFGKAEHKGPEYIKLNPNGRIPTIIDHHNNDFTVW